MSSRALRKLQRRKELQQQQQKKIDEDDDLDPEDDIEKSASTLTSSKPQNAFDLLNQQETGKELDHDEEEGTESDVPENKSDTNAENRSQEQPRRSKKKKKRKGKAKKPDSKDAPSTSPRNPQIDEIDQALQDLSLKVETAENKALGHMPLDADTKRLYELLAVDTKNLNAINEMKKLFGNAVLSAENEDAPGFVPGRRRGRRPQQVDLGGALAGRNSPASRGQGLAGLALRKNIFIVGKEEWPKATSGGLGMEVVEKAEDGTTEYRFVHHQVYQDVQRQFESCVESMDPQRMIALLQFNRKSRQLYLRNCS